MQSINFSFWSCKIIPGEIVSTKTASSSDTIHITMACYGKKIQINSRSVVNIKINNSEIPICVLLQGSQENQLMDLNLPGQTPIQFSIEGVNPSTVYLTGFVQPLIDINDLSTNFQRQSNLNFQLKNKNLKKKLLVDDKEILKEKKIQKNMNSKDINKLKKKILEEKKIFSEINYQKKKKKKFVFNEEKLGISIRKKGQGLKAEKGDKIRVRYIGQLVNKDMTVFDKNLTDGFTFELNRGEVIRGWDEGCQNIRVGEKRKIKIPSNLGYGNQGAGNVPPNSELMFTVECMEITQKSV
jgi:FKBP-type peptidyl-prolyl cis-trans isomerase